MPQPREQLDLLTSENPLRDKLGDAFWNDIPSLPGVYRFWSAAGDVLYVGKSGNLRSRLFSYKNARKTSVSSKIVRLIRNTERITYETTVSETEAVLLENKLIRELKPEFNSANKEPETYYYIHLMQSGDSAVGIELRMSAPDDIRENCFGAFKGHVPVRSAVGALHRTLHHFTGSDSPYPTVLNRVLTPRFYAHAFDVPVPGLFSIISRFLNGESDELLTVRENLLSKDDDYASLFTRTRLEYDHNLLQQFYQVRARFNYRIRRQLEIRDHLLAQEDYDDYLVLARHFPELQIRF
ncbi:MAG: GIY-YIG nuclease family protein [Balneolia bacterium]|nr:GIY-YIG nuclease family protein [Balneolia bacterium]